MQRRGQVILKNSKDCQYLYVIKSGTVQVLKQLDSKPIKSLAKKIELDTEEYISDIYSKKKYDFFISHTPKNVLIEIKIESDK